MFRRYVFCALIALVCSIALAEENAWNALKSAPTPASHRKSLTPFSSEQELAAWLDAKKTAFAARHRVHSAPSPSAAIDMKEEEKQRSGSDDKATSDSITNTQTAGVDEGGIVKVHGNYLVILRRGRLFTIDIQDNRLDPVSVIDAFTPGQGDGWYDELLVSGSKAIVIGYSYRKGGTEVVLFNIDEQGRLSWRATYILRSNDYYSSRNYASRIVGDKLIFYTPLYLGFYGNPLDSFPAMRRWYSNDTAGEFKRIAPATRIFRVDEELEPGSLAALHTVQICDLSSDEMTCEATAVIGPAGREFYVSQDAVFIWTVPFFFAQGRNAARLLADSAVFRLPLNGRDNPTALKTRGSPIDQFSFLESKDGCLNVLLRGEGALPSMWASEAGSRDLALLRVPVSRFGNGTESASVNDYHPLPASGDGSIQNRYIGDYLIYGTGETWARKSPSKSGGRAGNAYAVYWKNPEITPFALPTGHTLDRIEALDNHPLLVGRQGGDLYFSTFALGVSASGGTASAVDTFKLPNAAQGETRSHGFFYKPDGNGGGMLGLPFVGQNASAWNQLKRPSTGIVFLKNERLTLHDAGVLSASSVAGRGGRWNDHCKASCVDWYGNSRPIFLKGRIFALMGYELIEGRLKRLNPDSQRVMEIRRIDFTPRALPKTRCGHMEKCIGGQ